jgi:hypothetical protein
MVLTKKDGDRQVVYTALLSNWPQADGVLQLTLMEIADQICEDLAKAGYVISKREDQDERTSG